MSSVLRMFMSGTADDHTSMTSRLLLIGGIGILCLGGKDHLEGRCGSRPDLSYRFAVRPEVAA
eukprot:750907-Hanusia_phi.AAC.2